jgi:hypothetical protein
MWIVWRRREKKQALRNKNKKKGQATTNFLFFVFCFLFFIPFNLTHTFHFLFLVPCSLFLAHVSSLIHVGHDGRGGLAHQLYKFPFLDKVTISFCTKMHFDIFDTQRIPFGDIGHVGVFDIVAVYDDHQAASDRFHAVALRDEHAGIFSQPDADTGWVC